jgi:hypothetical protein
MLAKRERDRGARCPVDKRSVDKPIDLVQAVPQDRNARRDRDAVECERAAGFAESGATGTLDNVDDCPEREDTYGGSHPLELLAFDMVGAQQTHDDRCQGSDGRDYEEHDADVTD